MWITNEEFRVMTNSIFNLGCLVFDFQSFSQFISVPPGLGLCYNCNLT
jgi:hypothetical protein